MSLKRDWHRRGGQHHSDLLLARGCPGFLDQEKTLVPAQCGSCGGGRKGHRRIDSTEGQSPQPNFSRSGLQIGKLRPESCLASSFPVKPFLSFCLISPRFLLLHSLSPPYPQPLRSPFQPLNHSGILALETGSGLPPPRAPSFLGWKRELAGEGASTPGPASLLESIRGNRNVSGMKGLGEGPSLGKERRHWVAAPSHPIPLP